MIAAVAVNFLSLHEHPNNRGQAKGKSMKRLIVGAIAATVLGIGVAAPAQASCGLFDPDSKVSDSRDICGAPSVQDSIKNAKTNLHNNLSPKNAVDNLKKNLGLG
jgi:hypothetical protein